MTAAVSELPSWMFSDDSLAGHDLVCFSHLRWDFVYQRPNHLMERAARERRVYFVEEPLIGRFAPSLRVDRRANGLRVVLPYLPENIDRADTDRHLATLIGGLVDNERISDPILWFYTPMATRFSMALKPHVTVYDAMDELSAFAGAPREIVRREAELLRRADVVFTGGRSLYDAKRRLHSNVHSMPSAVDADHFYQARSEQVEPADQARLPAPRIGWFGVIDERMDLDLLRSVAAARREWSFVLIGPTVKIDPSTVPQLPNIHLLGPRSYDELPRYASSWDVAIMPFARNEATRCISPTKTLEYLAAGLPVVSTSIRDVVDPYGKRGLVQIADDVGGFVAAIENALTEIRRQRLARIDELLSDHSWDNLWRQMRQLIAAAAARRATRPALREPLAASVRPAEMGAARRSAPIDARAR